MSFSLAVLFIACAADKPTPSVDHAVFTPKTLDHGSFRCSAALRIDPPQVRRGGILRILCEIKCHTSGGYVFNPFLSEQSKLPAQIVLVSKRNGTRFEVLKSERRRAGDKKPLNPWVSLGNGKSIGRELAIAVRRDEANVPNLSPARSIDLPPGEYVVQAIYSHWAIASPPDAFADGDFTGDPQPPGNMTASEMDQPLLISEPAHLVVSSDSQSEFDPPSDNSPLRAELRPVSMQIIFGRQATVEIRMVNQSKRILDVYDPFINPILPRHAVSLGLLIQDGRYLDDLLVRRPRLGSMAYPSPSDWLNVPPGGSVARLFRFTAGQVTLDGDNEPTALPPGKYAIELRVHEYVISGMPAVASVAGQRKSFVLPAFQEWSRSFPGPEICRSNRIQLEILPRTGD